MSIATQSQEHIVHLGVPGLSLRNFRADAIDEETLDYAGGQPTWPLGAPNTSAKLRLERPLRCPKCERRLAHVCHLYAPLSHARWLTVFACNSNKCAHWRVIRQQSSRPPIERAQGHADEEAVAFEKQQHETTQPASLFAGEDWSHGGDLDDLGALLAARDAPAAPVAVPVDSEGNEAAEDTNERSEIIEDTEWPRPAQGGLTSLQLVFEEEPPAGEDDFAHERRLMAEYEARESAQKSNKQKKTQKTNADEVYAPEQYEETGDQAFEEFQLRLSRDPEQCVRYDYAGLPLYAARRKPKQIPRCSCGKRRVFEMQLMPNIVNELKPWKLAADKAGFSLTTAAIFTCSGNCGAGSLHDEFIFVQDI